MQDQIESLGMLMIKGVILPLVSLFVAWASMKLPALVQAKVKNETVAGVLDRLHQLVFNVVQEIQQTVVSSLGDKANGDALKAARDQALATIKSHLGPKGIKELEVVLGLDGNPAVERLIVTFIESSVFNLKQSAAAPAPAQA